MQTSFGSGTKPRFRVSWPVLLVGMYIVALGYRGWSSIPSRVVVNLATIRAERGILTGPSATFSPLPKGFSLSKVQLGLGELIAISDDGSVMIRQRLPGTRTNPEPIADYVVRRPNGKTERYSEGFATLRPDGKVVIARRNQLEVGGEITKLRLDPNHPFAQNPDLFMWGADLALSAVGDFVLVVHSGNDCSLIDKNGYTTWISGAKLKSENPVIAFGRIVQVFNARQMSYWSDPPALSASGKLYRLISDRSALYGSNNFGLPRLFEGKGSTFEQSEGNAPFRTSGYYAVGLDGHVVLHSTTQNMQQQWPYLVRGGNAEQLALPGDYRSAVCVGAINDSMMLFQAYPSAVAGGLFFLKSGKYYDLRKVMPTTKGYVQIPGQPGNSSVYGPYQRPISRSGAFVVTIDGKLVLFTPNMRLPD